MRRLLGNSEEEFDAAVDITPMLDVVFIMLIFFIVTATFVKESGIDVNPPRARTAVLQEKASILARATLQEKASIMERATLQEKATLMERASLQEKASILARASLQEKASFLERVLISQH